MELRIKNTKSRDDELKIGVVIHFANESEASEFKSCADEFSKQIDYSLDMDTKDIHGEDAKMLLCEPEDKLVRKRELINLIADGINNKYPFEGIKNAYTTYINADDFAEFINLFEILDNGFDSCQVKTLKAVVNDKQAQIDELDRKVRNLENELKRVNKLLDSVTLLSAESEGW